MTQIKYPTTDEIVEINKLVLREIKVKKADKPELLSYSAGSRATHERMK